MTADVVSPPYEAGVFGPGELDGLRAFFAVNGFASLRGLWPDTVVDAVQAECGGAQAAGRAGSLAARHCDTALADGDRPDASSSFVSYLTEIAPATRACATDPTITALMGRLLGPTARLLEHTRFGVVYQEARPGPRSGYTRIGWHTDWQSAPHRAVWPSVAFTIHLDPTGPDNGFLRVVPGSHRWATPAPYRNANGVTVPAGAAPWGGHTAEPPPFEMPLGFGKVPGEIGVYCERGDVLFHDAYLWHSAARATADDSVRRHVRGGWYAGDEPDTASDDDFVKNAAR